MSTISTRVIGSYVSPYVRKVLVCLGIKRIPYELDPIVPFFGNDAFAQISPLRRVPVLLDDRITVSDSTVICEYLEERYPEPPLFPREPRLRARARWLEEFADTRIGDVLIWHYFNELVIKRSIWREAPDERILEKAREEEIPSILDYLEREVPGHGFLFETISLADVSIASYFRNAHFAGFAIDKTRWPKTASFVSHVLDQDSFAALRPFEELCLRTRISNHRAALQEAGAPISADTLGTEAPRRGIMAT